MPTNTPTPRQEDTESLLREGISAAKSGQHDRARQLLTEIVEQNEENTLAWLWLSGVVDSLEDREVCLENVLTLDPDNDAARRGLAILRRQRLDRWLREGISAAKAGQCDRARELLTRFVEQDEENAQAWLWLSGVVDSLEDREVCLENVLALDPDNDAARRGLAQMRERRQAQVPAPAEVAPFYTTDPDSEPPFAPFPAGSDSEPPFAPFPASPDSQDAQSSISPEPVPAPALSAPDPAEHQPTTEEPRRLSIAPSDEFDDEYLCPYCAAPTKPDDRRCKACGGKLWIKRRKEGERSTWLWVALGLQALNTLPLLVPTLLLAFIVFDLGGSEFSAAMSQAINTYASLAGVSGAMVDTGIMVVFLIALVSAVLSLTILIGLYLRWKPAFYLFLAGAVLGLFWTVANIIMSFSADSALTLARGGSLFCSGLSVLTALARLMLAFQIQDDFAFEKRRILFHLDPDVSSGPMILARGHDYAKRKMWGMAALHMRRAALAMPNQVNPRIALTLTYLRMERYDIAAQTLEDARRIDPDNSHVAELQDMLDELRPGSVAS